MGTQVLPEGQGWESLARSFTAYQFKQREAFLAGAAVTACRKGPTMITCLPRWFACLVLVLPFVPVIAAVPDDAEIQRLVKQLGSDDFDKREEASKRLAEIGEPALDALHQALRSDDAEVRCRAENIVTAIENRLYPELCLTGHIGKVCTVSISADGKRVLTGSADKTLRLWDADTGKQLRVFEGHTERVTGAALSPDGKRVLSGGEDRTVRLWDATTGKELHKMTGHTDVVGSVAFGPEGKAISGCDDGTVFVWDLKTGKKAGALTGHTKAVRNVVYSAKAKLAATASSDQSIRLWDLETGKEVLKLTVATDKFGLQASFSPDGKRLLSSAGDATLWIWDVETGKELKQISVPNTHCACFSPDGKRIVSGGGYDMTVRLWDAATGQELRTYEDHDGGINCVTFFPDGKRIASGSNDNTVRIWRAPH